VEGSSENEAEDKDGGYSLTTPSGEEHQFTGIVWQGRKVATLHSNQGQTSCRFVRILSTLTH
jgi:hypothetical protein